MENMKTCPSVILVLSFLSGTPTTIRTALAQGSTITGSGAGLINLSTLQLGELTQCCPGHRASEMLPAP